MHRTGIDRSSQHVVLERSPQEKWLQWMDMHVISRRLRHYCLPDALARCNTQGKVDVEFPRQRSLIDSGRLYAATVSSISTPGMWSSERASVFIVDNATYDKLKCGGDLV